MGAIRTRVLVGTSQDTSRTAILQPSSRRIDVGVGPVRGEIRRVTEFETPPGLSSRFESTTKLANPPCPRVERRKLLLPHELPHTGLASDGSG